MSINTNVRTAGPFTGNSLTTVFAFAFEIFSASDLLVVISDVATGANSTLVLGTDYTVSLNSNQNTSPGGSITYAATLATGYTMVMTSQVAPTQLVALTNGGGFFPTVINTALDRLTILNQQSQVQIDNSIQFPIADGGELNNILPNAAQRVGKAIVFDSSGNVGVSADSYVNQTAASAASAAAALVSQNAAAASATASATSATASGVSATASAASAASANTYAGNSSTSATASASSATASGVSATASAGSATTATTQAGISTTQATASAASAAAALVSQNAAATSATNSANSATASATSAATSTTQAGNSSTSATASAASAAAALVSQNAAAASAAAAAASAGGFDLRGSVIAVDTAGQTGTYNNGASGVGATFTFTSTGVITFDTHALALNDQVLLTAQASSFQNGIYTVTIAGALGVACVLTRRSDYNQTSEVFAGTATIVFGGSTYVNTLWIMTTTGTITMGSGTMAWAQIAVTSALTLTGAVTGSGSGTVATTIPAASITNAQLAGSIDLTAKVTGTLPYNNGGTGQNAVTKGDLLYGSATNVFSRLGIGSAGQILGVASGLPAWVAGTLGDMNYNPQASTYTPAASDLGAWLPFTGSSGATWTLTAAATLGAGWWAILQNSGTANANLTLASSGGNIDGLSGYIIYPGEMRVIRCDGTNFESYVINGFSALFASSTTFKVPPGYKTFQTDIISSGQSGAARSTTGNASGGGGGTYLSMLIPASSFVAPGSTETVTIGGTSAAVSGNTNGNARNISSITVNGSTFPIQNAVFPGPADSVATNAAAASATTGGICGLLTMNSTNFTGYAPVPGGQEYANYGGDVTTGNVPSGGSKAILSGGGGGACSSTSGGVRTGGASIVAGAGGAGGLNTGGNGTNGTVPGGGGGGAVNGGTSGTGAAGRVTIRGIV